MSQSVRFTANALFRQFARTQASMPRVAVRYMSSRKVDIILKGDIKGVGFQFDKCAVQPGYARNYLIPKKLAWYATADKEYEVSQLRTPELQAAIAERKKAAGVVRTVEMNKLQFHRRSAAEGTIDPPVSAAEIVKQLAEKCGVEILSSQVGLRSSINRPGDFSVPCLTQDGLRANVKVSIALTKIRKKKGEEGNQESQPQV